MTQIALAWQYARGVAAPIIGATKARYFDDAVKSLDLKLSGDDIEKLEELYMPHKIVGAL
jgi:aryl-alcohol dehydrogenase-like predicted oxidoreductase